MELEGREKEEKQMQKIREVEEKRMILQGDMEESF